MPFSSAFQTLGDFIGISATTVSIIVVTIGGISITSVAFSFTGNLLLSLFLESGVLLFAVVNGIIPVWFLVIHGIFITWFIFNHGFGGFLFGENSKVKELSTREYVEKLSQKMELYTNNLDSILNIKTVHICRPGVKFKLSCTTAFCDGCRYDHETTKELKLKLNKEEDAWELIINNRTYDWYIVDKEKDLNLFTIVGLNKKRDTNRIMYKLGIDSGMKVVTLKKVIPFELPI